ncbi:TBC1 domain family member 5 [Protopterus annectens]|uniref:TBC1 domain family member 5 n=1 Tax=Protopterus annectens TaxID=7888 RepID=UPI001CF9768D|nr:TBC1 domain family member 5 [Protopterus annectens]
MGVDPAISDFGVWKDCEGYRNNSNRMKLCQGVLPAERSRWIKRTDELRAEYTKIKETHITNPRKAAGQQDLIVNNPLSQDEGSLWNKFFQDKELRAMIEQDVMRTFPEMQYFQQESVRNILTDILFCYARENEQLLYKQGMHELLAPIVFVLYCDHQAFLHASETAHPSEEMKILLNPDYLEHDAYAVFSRLMETAEPWFSSFEREVRKEKEPTVTTTPFARPQDTGSSIAIVAKVNHIQDHLLKKQDIELYLHLNRLEIAPQIYGIRWVRLLFGREFPLQDLLVIWDALFADSVTLDLVDYIFVAMLLYIRDVLIASNYQTCLGLLMHFPPVEDVHSLIHRALFVRDPKNNPRPVNYQFQQNLDYYKARGADIVNRTRASTKVPPINVNKVSSSLLTLGRKLIAGGGSSPPVVTSANSFMSSTPPLVNVRPTVDTYPQLDQNLHQDQQQRMFKSESMPVQLGQGDIISGIEAQVSTTAVVQTVTDLQGFGSKFVSSSTSVEGFSGGREYSASPPSSSSKKDLFFNTISRSRSYSKTMGKKGTEEDMEAQISLLQGQINDLEAMCKYCAKMMNIHIGRIQDVILKENLEKEDEILVSLAELKQIKDILKGSLRFNQSQLESEENEEITIADDHYCSSAQGHEEHTEMDQETKTPLTSQQATLHASLNSDSRHSDDYILVSKEDDEVDQLVKAGSVTGALEQLQASRMDTVAPSQGVRRHLSPVFTDPLMTGILASSSNSGSSPDDDSSNSKDSDFSIVNPLDI